MSDIELPDIELPDIELPDETAEKTVIAEEEPEIPDIVMPEADEAEPAIEEPVIEEPMIEEPVIEEPVIEEPAADIQDMEIPNMDGLDEIEFIKTESADTEQLEKSLENINSAEDLVAHDNNSIIDKMILSQPEANHDDDMMSEAEMDALLAAFDKKEEKKREKANEAEVDAILSRMQDEDVKAVISDTLADVSPEMMAEIAGINEMPAISDEEPGEQAEAAVEELSDEAALDELLSDSSMLDELLSDGTVPDDMPAAEEAPEEETSIEIPEEEIPEEEIPQEETPVEETPVEETPVEETPLEEMLSEEIPSDTESEGSDDSIMSEEQVDELLKSIEEMGDPTNATAPEEAELSDIIAGSDDADIAEIGELLDKNDNFEAVDPSLTEEEPPFEIPIPGLDDEQPEEGGEEELSPKEKKRREKQAKKEQKQREKEEKKKAKEAKKKRKGKEEPAPLVDAGGNGEFDLQPDDEEAFKSDMDEALAGMTFTDVPEEYDGVDLEVVEKGDEAASRKKKNGFFAKLVRTLTEPVDGEDEEELEELTEGVFAEETAKDIAKAGAEDNEQILKEMEGEEEPEDGKGKKGKKGKKEKKEKKVKEKKPKKEKQKDKELFKMPKLPKKRVALIMLCTLSLGVLIGVASMVLPYYTDIKDAHASFEGGDYKSTYMSLTGHKLNAEQQELYNKNLILYKLQQKLKSYRNYLKLGMMPDALNALVQGVKDVDELGTSAAEYGITDQFNAYAGEITYELDTTFGVSAEQARSWLELEDSREYTRALYEHIGPTVPENVQEFPVDGGTKAVPQGTSNSVIEGEEAEFESN